MMTNEFKIIEIMSLSQLLIILILFHFMFSNRSIQSLVRFLFVLIYRESQRVRPAKRQGEVTEPRLTIMMFAKNKYFTKN